MKRAAARQVETEVNQSPAAGKFVIGEIVERSSAGYVGQSTGSLSPASVSSESFPKPERFDQNVSGERTC